MIWSIYSRAYSYMIAIKIQCSFVKSSYSKIFYNIHSKNNLGIRRKSPGSNPNRKFYWYNSFDIYCEYRPYMRINSHGPNLILISRDYCTDQWKCLSGFSYQHFQYHRITRYKLIILLITFLSMNSKFLWRIKI